MGASATTSRKLGTYLQLGRISNLPTVWTNVLAGMVLAGDTVTLPPVVVLAAALSLFYIGGMFLNDAFDREHDRLIRPDRPIPAGMVTPREVLTIGFGMLAGGLLLLSSFAGQGEWQVTAAGLLLALLIVFYDLHHKQNPWSPLVMAGCRAMIYVIAALSIGPTLPGPLLLGAALLFCYIIGLSFLARFEDAPRPGPRWPFVLLWVPFVGTLPLMSHTLGTGLFSVGVVGWMGYATRRTMRGTPHQARGAIGLWIAGISLLDACLIAGQGRFDLTLYAVAGCLVTVTLQRSVQGT